MRKALLLFCLGIASLEICSVRAEAPDPSSAYVSTQDTFLQRADALERGNQYHEAIVIYEDLLREGGGRDSRWTAYVLFRLACNQHQIGERVSALESASVAMGLDPAEPSYKAFYSDLESERTGRARSRLYRAARDTGSAKRLVAVNGVLHIFVRGRNTEPWEPEDQDRARRGVEEADRWLQARAAEKGPSAPPVFVHRFLTVNNEPFWRRVDVPDPDSSQEFRKAWMEAVLARFDAASFAELVDHTFGGIALDQRSVVFHSSRKGIDLALLAPRRNPPSDLESAFVSSELTEWSNPYEAVAYTHEFLHLYGADDLYNKKRDPDLPENEIMNLGAHDLGRCRLSDLTRYAIGWIDEPPRLASLRVAGPGLSLSRPKKGKHT